MIREARGSLLILFGDIEFDGRAKRMTEIARSLGPVHVVDVSYDSSSANTTSQTRLVRKQRWSKVRLHFHFWRTVLSVARRQKPRIVFAEDFFAAFPGLVVAKICGAKLVYDAHELIIPGGGRRLGVRSWFWYLLERIVAPLADVIIAANPERAEIMAQHYSLREAPTFMRNIPAKLELEAGERAEVLAAYPMLGTPLGRTLIYQGAMTLSRGLSRFVEVIPLLPDDFRLVLAGGGPNLPELRELVSRLGISHRVQFLGAVSNRALPVITERCDVGIVTYPYTGLNNIYCAPNKIFEYAQAGLPVIATDQPPLKSLLSQHVLGELVSPESTREQVRDAIIRLAQWSLAERQVLRQVAARFDPAAERDRVLKRLSAL